MSIKRVVIVVAVLLMTVISAGAQSPEDLRSTTKRSRYIFPSVPRAGVPRAAPANDNFASPTIASSTLPYTDTVADFDQATGEEDEPSDCLTDTASVWYSFMPDSNQFVTIDTEGSSFDTVLAVYTGVAVDDLTLLACKDDLSFLVDRGFSSTIVGLSVTAGSPVLIRVGAYANSDLEPGEFSVLNIKTTPSAKTFAVDSFADDVDAAIGDGTCATLAVGCTLRAAVNEANASLPGSTINLPAGIYAITRAAPIDPEDADFYLFDDGAVNGDLDIVTSIAFNGAGPLTTVIDGGDLDTVMEFMSGANVALSGIAFRNGRRGGFETSGGGLRLNGTAVVIADNIWVAANEAMYGAGIAVDGGSLVMTDSAITDNLATGTSYENDPGDPNDTTYSAGTGGGLYVKDTIDDHVSIDLTNVTVSSNIASVPSATVNARGGGIYLGVPDGLGQLTVSLNNVTIAANSASNGGGIFTATGVVNITTRNTLLGDNVAANNPDCRGNIGSEGSNVIENSLGCMTAGPDIVNQDVRLNGLFLNAPGSTPTHLPRSTSPARNAAIASGCALADQRDISRPQAAQCDIGALEALNVVPGAFALVSPTHEFMFPSATGLTEFVWQASDVNAFSYVVTLDDISSGIPVTAFSATVRPDEVCVAGTCTLPFSDSLADGFYRYKVTAYADTNATASTTSHLVQVDSVAGLPNLLANGGFETKAANGQAAKWNAKKVSGEKRVCNTTVTYSYKENCAYLFRGGKLESSSLKQVLNINGMAFEANNKFRLSFYAQPGPAVNASVMLKVVYTRKSITPSKIKIMLPAGDQTWIPLSGEAALKHQRVERVLLIFKHYSKKGKLLIDEVRTIYIDDSVVATPLVAMTRDQQNGGLLPPPAAPDGFRGNN
jgi:CSLREA domain-containing protein